jgi:hypothetical protein
MRIEHYLAAYDQETENFLSFVTSVPAAYLPRAKEIARVKSTDPEAIGSYQLSKEQASRIAGLVGKTIESYDGAVFFLEPAKAE